MISEAFGNVTALLVALLLLFSLAVPVQASSPNNSNQSLQEETPTSTPVEAPVLAATTPPTITVWYEQSLRYGQIGNPQTQVNILGNVRDPDGSVSSLSYRLNNGPATAITIGPDGLRLENQGDFNIAINTTVLVNGTNNLLITATDNSGTVQTKTISFSYTRGKTWPQRYTTSWGTGSINDQAQVVDGLWQQSASGVRPQQVGYDRVIAIGDMSWTNYEILVPITVNQWFPVGTDGGGVGVIARWQGHQGTGTLPSDWTRIGAYAYYSNRLSKLALRLDGTSPVTQSFPFNIGTTYLFKLRAETVGTAGRYSFKIWEKGQPEPAWTDSRFANIVNVDDTNNDLLQGSMLLVAHRVDATFGNVSVCPLNLTYPLSVGVNGGGSITSQPNKTTFQCGEGVTLTAKPDNGWTFTGWSGGITSSSSSISFNMTQPYTLTANFQQAQPVTQDYTTFLPFIKK